MTDTSPQEPKPYAPLIRQALHLLTFHDGPFWETPPEQRGLISDSLNLDGVSLSAEDLVPEKLLGFAFLCVSITAEAAISLYLEASPWSTREEAISRLQHQVAMVHEPTAEDPL